MNLSSGLIPTEKAKEDILKSYKMRKLDFARFVEEKNCYHTVSFYDPTKQNKLKSFNAREMGKKRGNQSVCCKSK